MTFTYDLSTDIGKLRLRILNKDSTDYTFEDEELQAYLDMNNGDLNWSLVMIYETLCAQENATAGDEIKIGDIEIDEGKQKAKNYCDLAKTLRKSIVDGTVDGNSNMFFYSGGIYASDRRSNQSDICCGEIIAPDFTDHTFDDTNLINDECDC